MRAAVRISYIEGSITRSNTDKKDLIAMFANQRALIEGTQHRLCCSAVRKTMIFLDP
jgi:hypothetical protein